MNSLCSCSLETESMEHFLSCHNYAIFCTTLMNEWDIINSKFNTLKPKEIIRTILYWDKNFNNDFNFKILSATINFIKQIQQFEQALFWHCEIDHISFLVKIYLMKYFTFSCTWSSKELLWLCPVFVLLFFYC